MRVASRRVHPQGRSTRSGSTCSRLVGRPPIHPVAATRRRGRCIWPASDLLLTCGSTGEASAHPRDCHRHDRARPPLRRRPSRHPTPTRRRASRSARPSAAIEDALLARPGVVGVDIGEKWSDGRPTGRQAIVVHVERKRADDDALRRRAHPGEIDGIPTDVVEHRVSPLAAASATRRGTPAGRIRPLAGGLSIGPADAVTVPVDGAGAAPLRQRHARRRWCASATPAARSASPTGTSPPATASRTSAAPGSSPRSPTAATPAATASARSCAAP